MSVNQQQLFDKLQQLRATYASELPATVNSLQQKWQDYNNETSPDRLDDLVRGFHKLAGSGATYGYPDVTRICREIETTLATCYEQHTSPDQHSVQKISTSLQELVGLAQGKPQPLPEDNLVSANKPASETDARKLIAIVEDDKELAEAIRLQLEVYGYNTEVYNDAEAFAEACELSKPDLVIMDIFLPDADGTSLLKRLNEKSDHAFHSIMISRRDDTRARLRAVRAGVNAFFAKPLNLTRLIDKTDELLHKSEREPFRVLVVDDDKASSEFFKATLEQVGMTVRATNEPMKVMDEITDFSPELILLDLYMPGCDGPELAEVIRQQENYLGMPIVFLSSEVNRDKQLQAMDKGGDDFLTKPIHSQHLVASVTNRILRYRQLHSLMVRDSLTGLYNHTSIRDILDKEVSRSMRHKHATSYAIVDIDHFKSVNDTYGHATGDRVIKLLSRLLTQRLRKSDYVGRYGGEEFAVIMTETDIESATMVLNRLREDFAKITIHADGKDFQCTFSCGVADCPAFSTPSQLAESADKALYEAKETGRNRVVVARPEAN